MKHVILSTLAILATLSAQADIKLHEVRTTSIQAQGCYSDDPVRSKLFASEESKAAGLPELGIFDRCDGRIHGFPLVVSGLGETGFIADVGDVKMENAWIGYTLSLETPFKMMEELKAGHTYAVMISNDLARASYFFRVESISKYHEVKISYVFREYKRMGLPIEPFHFN